MGHQGEVADSECRRPSSPANKSLIFYRMIVSSIIQDKKLRIPGKFVKKLGNELPAVATLSTPNGCNWEVKIRKIDDKFWFTVGWHEFVKHQSICVGFLLFFTYIGNSNFTVNIYDLGTAEISYKCNNMGSLRGPSFGNRCRVPYKEEAKDNDSVEIVDSLPPCQNPTPLEARLNRNGVFDSHGSLSDEAKGDKQHISKHTGLNNSHYEANGGRNLHVYSTWSPARSTRDIGIQCGYNELVAAAYETRLHCLSQRSEIPRKRKREIGNEGELSTQKGSEVRTPGIETSNGTFLRRWRVVTPEEKERVLNESKTFESENPFCRVFLRRSYVYKGIGLHMPSSFAEKYLGGVSGFVTLVVSSGEKWPVRCTWSNGSAKLSKGWPEFVRDNRLEEGDVCVFELVRTDEVVLKVALFRGCVENAEPLNQQLPKEKPFRIGQLASGYDLNG